MSDDIKDGIFTTPQQAMESAIKEIESNRRICHGCRWWNSALADTSLEIAVRQACILLTGLQSEINGRLRTSKPTTIYTAADFGCNQWGERES